MQNNTPKKELHGIHPFNSGTVIGSLITIFQTIFYSIWQFLYENHHDAKLAIFVCELLFNIVPLLGTMLSALSNNEIAFPFGDFQYKIINPPRGKK